jgi:hypothetical protein
MTNIDDINSFDIKYDIIILSNVIEHIKDDFNTIELLFNLLSENGKLCISFPTDIFFDDDPRHFRTYSLDKFAEDLIILLKDVNIVKRYLPPTLMLMIVRFFFIKVGLILIKISKIFNFNKKNSLDNNIKLIYKNDKFINIIYFKIIVPVMKFILKFDFLISAYIPTAQGYIEIIKVSKK